MNQPYPGKEGNYFESSAAAMFTYGLLAGLREGWLDEAEYLTPATNAYKHLIDDFVTENANGTLTWEGTVEVGSLGSNATFEVSPHAFSVVFSLHTHMLTNFVYSITSAFPLSSTIPAASVPSFSRPLSGRREMESSLKRLLFATGVRDYKIGKSDTTDRRQKSEVETSEPTLISPSLLEVETYAPHSLFPSTAVARHPRMRSNARGGDGF